MRRILNEVARMKKIAGIISEGKYEEGRDDRAKKLEKIALKVHAKIENSVDVEDDMLQMSKREIAEFVPKGAPVKAIVDLVHSYMRGNMPLPDDFEDDRPEFDYEDDPDRMVYERGADLADASEVTMEGDEVNEARGGQAAKIKAIISKLKPKDSGGMQFADYGDELVEINDIYVFRGGIGIPGYRGVAVGQGIDDQGAAGATLYWLLTGDMESDDPNGYPSGVLEPGEGESDDYDDSSLPSYDQKSKKWFFKK